jgi:hypothetical protein
VDTAGIDPVHGRDAERWNGWHWEDPARGEHFRRCSFCGSVNPDDLAAEQEWRAEWSDRKYGWPHKFYVDITNREPSAVFAIGSTFGAFADAPKENELGLTWVAWSELTAEQQEFWTRQSDGKQLPRYVGYGNRTAHHAKFYSVHLADPELSAEIKDIVERGCGLRFRFINGIVEWANVESPEDTIDDAG